MSHRSAGRGCSRLVITGLFAVSLCSRASLASVGFGQFDDFLNGNAGWTEGTSSPNPPTVVSGGGPGGASDPYLQNVSTGGFGAGSRQIMFNQSQWTGNFSAAGVTRVEMMIANFGATPLSVRIAFSGAFAQFASTAAVELPVGSGWRPAVFNLNVASITPLSTNATVAQGLANVTEFRILSAANGPGYNGDGIAGTLGVDSIRALRQPGDATFDGNVDFADLVVLAQNYNRTAGATWNVGDFNFDHAVDFADLVVLAQNYNTSSIAGTDQGVGGFSFGGDWALAQSLVPEPCAGLLTLGGMGTLARRRPQLTTAP